MKQVSKDHASFLRDTCDFLLHIQNIENLPDNAILATIDVTGLYTHIPRDKGMQATREALDRRADKTVPTDFIVKLLSCSPSGTSSSLMESSTSSLRALPWVRPTPPTTLTSSWLS